MNRPRVLLRACALALLIALPAAARQIIIQNFDEQVVVHRDSTIDVTERIRAQFVGEGWHGIYRTIPIQYPSPEGFNYTLFIDRVSATDDSGASLKVDQSHQGHYLKLKIWVPEPDNSTRTIVLHYRVLDALRFFSDHDELYWNVTGEEWDAPIETASAQIELPEGVEGVRAIAYTGVFGSRSQDAQVTISDNVIQVHSNRPLGYHQGLTAVVGFDKGLVHEPTASERISLFLESNWPLFLPFLALGIMLWLWWTRGRDPERDAVTVQYDPPDNLTPAECGTLVDDDAGMRDITATLVDLAVKGYLTIEQKEQSGLLGLTHHRDYIFHMKRQPNDWKDARPHELQMLSALFDNGGRADVQLADLQNHFYTHLPAIRDGIFNALVSDGYYLHRPDTVRQGYIGGGLVVGFMVVFFGIWYAGRTGMAPLTWFFAGALIAAVICIFGWFMPARTSTGAKTFAKVLGFEDFLSRVESDRIKRMENAPELFEKYLPYAMALRVEKKWVQAFSGIAIEPPQWYSAPYGAGFQPFLFVTDLNLMSSQVGMAMAAAPRSSSGGSGFGGGGGAGGGFGGGGGGGF
ncbi:MAG TPA: DUF2207 domain-containing protein [Candidatus Limnocylindrales bacterium]|nr:DUF2207 domain-containing protein [Candidatus Limnocylindrales bacterium]